MRIEIWSGLLVVVLAISPASGQFFTDCDSDGVTDVVELQQGTAQDCDESGVPDNCELDCNGNQYHDSCDLANGTSADCNVNAIPDECDSAVDFDAHAIDPNYIDFFIFLASSGVADLDGDGDLDIAASTGIGVVWFENTDGAGSFTLQPASSKFGYAMLTLVDIDRDSDVDILAGGRGWIIVYENVDGFATFDEFEVFPWVDSDLYTAVRTADLDGDGDLDLLGTADRYGDDGEVVWCEHLDGNGTFGPPQTIEYFDGNDGAISVVTGDFDGDGDLDVAATNYDSVRLYENEDGAGTLGEAQVVASMTIGNLEPGDVDGDGDLDLVVADYLWPFGSNDYSVWWLENLAGQGTFGPPRIVADQTGWPAVADMDGDGDLDFVAMPYEEQDAAWYENLDGRGAFGPRQPISAPEAQSYAHEPLALGDLDGDGDLDAVGTYFFAWFENLTADCDGNSIPDACEADCNANGLSDVCDVRRGASGDCDADAFPDECESTCTVDCDPDGDLCPIELDCAPDDPETWSEPGPALNLIVSAGSPTSISWYPPAWSGSVAVRYDTLRSEDPADFSAAECLASDRSERTSEDSEELPVGGLSCYLVRVENDCLDGQGAMGRGSDGTPRSGRSCL